MSDPSFASAVRLFQTGQAALAEAECRRLLAVDFRHPDANHLLGVILLQAGRLAEAVPCLEAAHTERPENINALIDYGTVLAMTGQIELAHLCFEKAARNDPENVQALYNLGLSFSQRGQQEDAMNCFAALLAKDSGNVGALMGQGAALAALGRFDEAAASFAKADGLAPRQTEILENLALALLDGARHSEAKAVIDQIPAFLQESRPRILLLRARIHRILGSLTQAESDLQKVIALVPDFIEALVNLGGLYCESDRWEKAEEMLRRVLKTQPNHIEALYNLGLSLHRLERLDEAEACYRHVLERSPKRVEAVRSLAVTLKDQGKLEDAIALYQRIQDLAPQDADALWNLSLAYLQGGRLEEGWDLFANRWRTRDFLPQIRFAGLPPLAKLSENLKASRVLVWGEQGIGDEISFASALPDLIELAGQVLVECSPKLVPLFTRSFPAATVSVKNMSQDAFRADFDFHLPIGDLFCLFRRRIEDFPARNHYLQADAERRRHWSKWLGGLGQGRKIGISWRSSLNTRLRMKRFFSDLLSWGPILSHPGIVFVNLQPDASEEELRQAEKAFGTTIHRPPDIDMYNDIDDTAALMCGLDLVISAGTSVDILAAGLGVPTWMFYLEHGHWDCLGTGGIPWLPRVRLLERRIGEDWSKAVLKGAEWLSSGPARG